jgi:predicted NUDIX family NTP pyrophosphohydrolase
MILTVAGTRKTLDVTRLRDDTAAGRKNRTVGNRFRFPTASRAEWATQAASHVRIAMWSRRSRVGRTRLYRGILTAGRDVVGDLA